MVALLGCGDDASELPVECGNMVEPADGYPTLGSNCRVHVVFDGGEMASEKGVRGFGGSLSGFRVESGSDTMSIVLPEFEDGTHNDDCGTVTYNELTSGIEGNFTVTVTNSGNAMWGTFQAKACTITDTMVIGGESFNTYRCKDLVGRFSALRDAPEDCSACDPPALGPTECLVPYCSASDLCERVTCNATSSVCGALAPEPEGTYRGDIPYPTTIIVANGTITTIRVEGIAEATSPTDPQSIPVVYEKTDPATLRRDGARLYVEANLTRTPSWSGLATFLMTITPSFDGATFEAHGSLDPASDLDIIELDGTLVRQ